jgi:ABC-2 type transport system ATP-binding protein
MDEAEHCHRLAFIQTGRLVALGSPETIKAEKMQGQVLELDCSAPEAAIGLLRDSGWFTEVSLYGAQIHLVAEDVDRYRPDIERLLSGENIKVKDMEIIFPSLEDVFIASLRENA